MAEPVPGRMLSLKSAAWVAAAYAAAAVGGFLAAVYAAPYLESTANAHRSLADFQQLGLGIVVAGGLSMLPTVFLLRQAAERAPAALARVLLAMSATGALCWMISSGPLGGPQALPPSIADRLGSSLFFPVILRAAATPILLLIECAALVLVREHRARRLVAAAVMLEILPPVAIFIALVGAAGRGR